MPTWRFLFLSFTAILFLSGCATIRGFPERPTKTQAVAPAVGWQLGPDAVVQYNKAGSSDKKRLRNEIIDAKLADLDERFADYERAIYKEGIGAGVGTDWVLLGLTAGSTVSTVESTKTLLSALATAVVGGQASFDKRALFEKTLPALMAQMVAERETIRAIIRGNQDLPVESYTLSAAESDLKKFEFAGSIPGAITAISQDAGQKAGTAKQSLQDIRTATFGKSKTGSILKSFWKPDGENIDPENETRILKWMSDNGFVAKPGRITLFVNGKEFESARAKAVADLGLQPSP